MFIGYYIICVIYCFYQLSKKYNKKGIEYGTSPELDSIMVLIMAWVLAPVDVAITWINMVKKAEEVKRRQDDFSVSFKNEPKRERELLKDSIYE